jgi:hypothetical protein
MAQEPESNSSQPASLAGSANAQVHPPVLAPVPRLIAPLIVETNNPKLRRQLRWALILAVLIDSIQIAFFPLFAPGFISVADDLVDCVAFLLFWRLVGWHWALLPGFATELIPFADLVPTWTLAVYIAVRAQSNSSPGLKSANAKI